MTARSDFRLVSFLVAAALWVVGCGEPQPPVAMGSIPGLAVEVGNTVSVDLTGYFSDADGDILSYRATSSHSRVQVSVSGASVQVTAVAAGTATVTVTATDPGGLSAEQEFPVTVPNRAPEAVGRMPDAETFVGESVEVALADHFSDPDGDALAYAATSADEGVATVGVTGSTLRVAGVGQGVATVTVTATDPGGLSAEQEFPVTVPNRAPEAVGEIADAETFVGESVEVALADHFSDPDGDALAYAATSADEGVATVGVTGSTLRVAGVGQGVATVTVTATDPGGLSAEQEFPVTVPNRAPEAVGEIADAETFVGESVEVALADHFGDPDGDALAYAATSADEGVATVGVTGSTLRVAGVGQGVATVTVTATDPGGLSAEQEFPVTVPNRAPEAVGRMPDAETFVGESVEVALADHFGDPDGDALAYAATSADEGVATVGVTGSTLRVAGVGQGVATVTVTATDPGGLSAEQEFPVTVPNRAPEAVGRMPDAETFVGESVEVALATLRVAGVGQGVATVTVTA
ncbi:MAG: Ig-like domain-containing protein, partial [Gemmatimonadota bacterium]|nr:Ig-like domain-containing protein [Gemmatimonadota bacterium]